VPGDRADHVFTRALNGSAATQLTREDYNDETPSYSPDGAQVVFTRNLQYNWGGLASSWGTDGTIYIMQADGSQLHAVTPANMHATGPAFAPDGKSAVFWAVTRGPGFPRDLYRRRTDGTQAAQKLTANGQSREVAVSPDGKYIVCSRGRYSSDHQIYLMMSDGRGSRRLTNIPGGCFKPRFSRDGKCVFFLVESWPNGPGGLLRYSLWQVGVDGKNPKEIAGSSLFEKPSGWSR
jgi:TolB protein